MDFTSVADNHKTAGMYAFGPGSSWYDPKAGRGVQPDPLAYEQGRGAYTTDGPTVDRWGRFFGGVGAACFAAAGASELFGVNPALGGGAAAAEAGAAVGAGEVGAGTEASMATAGEFQAEAGQVCDPNTGGCFVAG